jgi:hypothetical protein
VSSYVVGWRIGVAVVIEQLFGSFVQFVGTGKDNEHTRWKDILF